MPPFFCGTAKQRRRRHFRLASFLRIFAAMKHKIFLAVASVFLLTCGFLMASGQSESAYAPTGSTTWTVVAGSETIMEQTEHGMMGAWQYAKFYPDQLAVNVGDTVIFKFTATMAHDVVFAALA